METRGNEQIGREAADFSGELLDAHPPAHGFGLWCPHTARGRNAPSLTVPFSQPEIWLALKEPKSDVFFFHEFWDVVKEDITGVFKEFTAGNSGFGRINCFFLFLIPKNPSENRGFQSGSAGIMLTHLLLACRGGCLLTTRCVSMIPKRTMATSSSTASSQERSGTVRVLDGYTTTHEFWASFGRGGGL